MGWLKGSVKLWEHEDGEVGVLALLLLEAVAVDHGQVVVIVLLCHEAAGVLAEGADLVLPGLRVADELGLIQHLVHLFHDLVAALDADTDVHGAGLVGDMVLCTNFLKPVCAAAAGADDHGVAVDGAGLPVALTQQHALALLVFEDDVLALGGEEHLHAVVSQIVLDGEIELLCLLGAEVADGAVHQLQTGVDGVLADLLDVLAGVDALHMGVSAELEVDLVGVVDELLGKVCADEAGQVAADLIGEAQLAVGEGARTGEAGGDGAGGAAVDAVAVSALGQWRFSTGLPFSTSRMCFLLPRRSSSTAVKMPAGPAPTMMRSYFSITLFILYIELILGFVFQR